RSVGERSVLDHARERLSVVNGLGEIDVVRIDLDVARVVGEMALADGQSGRQCIAGLGADVIAAGHGGIAQEDRDDVDMQVQQHHPDVVDVRGDEIEELPDVEVGGICPGRRVKVIDAIEIDEVGLEAGNVQI